MHSLISGEDLTTKITHEILVQAIKLQASDIHLEQFRRISRVRLRVDGLLMHYRDLPIEIAERVNSKIKIMARLDIAEKRLPQDGRFFYEKINFRISTSPTMFGEKLVLRLLDCSRLIIALKDLGFMKQQLSLLMNSLKISSGMILIAGATGSGKTVTLYSILNYLNSIEKNISTIEDPIEIDLEGINQINVNTKINLDYPTILKNLLRQDPDIIMIGEIRDSETARLAFHAAQTGHLILSTIHTNSASETQERLLSLGVHKNIFLKTVKLVLFQKLIRRLCNFCKKPHLLSNKINSYFKNVHSIKIYEANACELCQNGYTGRIAIFELLPPENKDFILKNIIQSLNYSAIQNVLNGITSLEEAEKILSCRANNACY